MSFLTSFVLNNFNKKAAAVAAAFCYVIFFQIQAIRRAADFFHIIHIILQIT